MRALDIAQKIAGSRRNKFDELVAAIERVDLKFLGDYLVLLWATQFRASGPFRWIIYGLTPGTALAARQIASTVFESLVAVGGVPEPSMKAYGPSLRPSSVPVLARVSARVDGPGLEDRNHVTALALGPFPNGVVSTELVDMFATTEHEQLRAFFLGPENVFYPHEHPAHEDASSQGSPNWILFQIQRSLLSFIPEKQQLDWAESRITRLDGPETSTAGSETETPRRPFHISDLDDDQDQSPALPNEDWKARLIRDLSGTADPVKQQEWVEEGLRKRDQEFQEWVAAGMPPDPPPNLGPPKLRLIKKDQE
jgi:hypothetical protein